MALGYYGGDIAGKLKLTYTGHKCGQAHEVFFFFKLTGAIVTKILRFFKKIKIPRFITF